MTGRRLEPSHLLAPTAAAVALLAAAGPIDDASDAFWHVVVGDEMRATRSVTGIGDGWAWYDPPEPWTSSQWLAEVAMSWGVDLLGWHALVIGTLTAAIVIIASLWWVISTRTAPFVGSVLFAAIVLPLSLSFQTRPGLVSLLGAIWMGHVADRTLNRGVLPSWWLLPAVTLWANLHGGWVLAPAVLGLAVVLRWLESPRQRLGFVGRGSALVVGTLVAGCLTPLGTAGLTLPFALRASTRHIGEWQTTSLFNGFALPLTVVLVSAVVAWARTRGRVPPSEIVFVLVVAAFGLVAYRNVALAAVVLAPIVARRLGAAFDPMPRETGRREHRLLVATFAALAVTGAAWVGATVATTDPLERASPLAIAERLSEGSASIRVLNHYNAAGVLVAFGPPGLELGIDGRAERFGQDYIDQYLDVFGLSGSSWQEFIEDFRPEAAVVSQDQAILHYLRDDLGWRVALVDGDWLLLEPAGGA